MQGAQADKNGSNNFVAGLASMSEVELIQRAGYLQRHEDENTVTEPAGDSSELAEQRQQHEKIMQSYKDSMRRQYEQEQAKKPSVFSGKFSQATLEGEVAATVH